MFHKKSGFLNIRKLKRQWWLVGFSRRDAFGRTYVRRLADKSPTSYYPPNRKHK